MCGTPAYVARPRRRGHPAVVVAAAALLVGCIGEGDAVLDPRAGAIVYGAGTIAGYLGTFSSPGDAILLETRAEPEGWVLHAASMVKQGGWAGWFIEVGTSQPGEVRDLSVYAGGSIRLRVRGTRDLEFAVRSGNLIAGRERSKVLLSTYGFAPDGEWHDVALPIRSLAVKEPFLALEQVEVLAALTHVARQQGEAGAFAVESIRWVRE